MLIPRARSSSGVSCLTLTLVERTPTTFTDTLDGTAGWRKRPWSSSNRTLSSA
jgi:hypothetical protein